MLAATRAALLLAVLAPPLQGQLLRDYSVGRAVAESQPPLRALLEFGAGRVVVRASTGTALYDARIRYDAERYTPVHLYQPLTGALHLGLERVGRGGIRVTSRGHLDQVARFEFSPRVPLQLEANLGSSDAVFDMGGLNLVSLAVRSGATRGTIEFSSPTTGRCSQLVMTAGAGELTALHLANSGCTEVRVEGGVGRAVLDLSGEWRRDMTIDAALAMGTMTLRIPRGTGVELSAERFLTRLSVTGLEREGERWRTPGFRDAARKVVVNARANVAGIEIEWID
ncbi:MAG TPA: hypothetical protein PLL69_09840 [Gemmatimonadales bacterium]|nr:hypothetical protein [Gemmatimonadales bacterium]